MVDEAYQKLSHVEKRLFAKYAGKTIESAQKLIIPFYRVLPVEFVEKNGKTYKINEQAFLGALCIRCIYEDVTGQVVEPEYMIAEARISKKISSIESFDKRISIVMSEMQREYFISKMARLFKYAKELTAGYIPDCDQIYRDICFYNSENKDVQRRWARSIYSNR